jgi:hypothetical protein
LFGVIILHYVITATAAAQGGGVAVDGKGTSIMSINSTTFDGCTASLSGGGINILSPVASGAINDCQFVMNTSPAGGGVFLASIENMHMVVDNNLFTENNSTDSSGGGILQQGTEMRAQITNNVFKSNHGLCCYADTDRSSLGGGCLDVSAGYSTGW